MLSGIGWSFYFFHGGNICSKEHYCRITAHLNISEEQVKALSAEIRRAVRYRPIPRLVVVWVPYSPVFNLS